MRDEPHHEPLCVVVIEDDADTRANLADILELDEHRIETAGSIAEARGRSDWSSVSVVLLDRKLPDGNAEDFLPELRLLAPSADVMVVTGYRDLEGALACLRQGASDYILKPVNADALRASLQRVAKERRRERHMRLLETAVRDVHEGIMITDADLELPGPRIMFVNEAIEQMTGYSADELLGRTPRIFQSARTDRTVLDRLKEQLRQGKSFSGELMNRRKDGTAYYAEITVSPVFDPSGHITNYVATQRDVTVRKLAEERLLQTERLAAIGQMMTGLAHESRNALQRGKACLEMLAIEVEDRPDALDLVARANKAQDHLHHLYEEVRSYAAPLNLRRQQIRMSDVWREAWSQLELTRTDRKATLREEAGGVNVELHGDSFALGQVFLNIFDNALAACPDPCEVVVSCLPVRLNGQPAVRISVLDNGPGLHPEQARRIFEPFYTTKTKGTGLGMAIAKRIVESHGGQIAASDIRSKGAEIVVTLPRQAPSRPANP